MGRLFARFFRRRGFHVLVNDRAGGLAGFPSADIQAAGSASVVVVSASLPGSAEALAAAVEEGPRGLVFDVASVKAPLLPVIALARRRGIRIASAHPMFGPEVRSLRGHDLIVCDAGDPGASRAVRRLFAGTGLRIRTMPISEHDSRVAATMSLAHLVALVTASTFSEARVDLRDLDGLASTSCRRLIEFLLPILHQDEELTRFIQTLNPESPAVARLLAGEAEAWRKALFGGDAGRFGAKLLKVRAALGRR